MSTQIAKVIFRDEAGRPAACYISDKEQLFEICQNALEHWKKNGYHLTPDTILEVTFTESPKGAFWEVRAAEVPPRQPPAPEQTEMFPPDPRRALD